MSGINQSESVVYKMFIQDEDLLSQTPAEMKVELIPTSDGFYRVQTLEGPGVSLIDTLKVSKNGLPIMHTFLRGRTRHQTYYQDREALTVIQGDTFVAPIEYNPVYDIIQTDLVLKGIDTLGNKMDVAFFMPERSELSFFEIAEIRKDTIGSDWYAQDSIATSHRYAVTAGTVYEGWYADDQVLPIKWRVSTNGTTYVYLRLPELLQSKRETPVDEEQ